MPSRADAVRSAARRLERVPGVGVLVRRVRVRVRGRRLAAPVPERREHWDSTYARGDWAYLEGVDELSHYSVIVGYAAHLRPGGSVLDVGCGHGVLWERLRDAGMGSYTGADLSEVALQQLRARAEGHDIVTVRADAETYEPEGRYDVVVLNEVAYYLSDPVGAVGRLGAALTDDGILVVSCFLGAPQMADTMRRIRAAYHAVSETTTTQRDVSWSCAVFERAALTARR